MNVSELSIEQFRELMQGVQQPTYVNSISDLAIALGISRQTCQVMLNSGKYNKAIHHLIGNTYRYNVDKIMEISRLK